MDFADKQENAISFSKFVISSYFISQFLPKITIEKETEMSVYSMLMWKPLNEILLSTLVVLLSFNKCQVYTMFILFHFLLLLLVVVVGRRFYRFFMYCSITIFMQIILLYVILLHTTIHFWYFLIYVCQNGKVRAIKRIFITKGVGKR